MYRLQLPACLLQVAWHVGNTLRLPTMWSDSQPRRNAPNGAVVTRRLDGGEAMKSLMNTRRLKADLLKISHKLEKVPEWSEPGEWPEESREQPSASLEAELAKCAQLRKELR
jgi:hypothetical protein